MSLFDALLLDPAPFHVWIANRADSQRGSGTASDPFHGGLVGSVSQFDTIMNLTQVAQANVVIHLGPGTFLTNGYYDGISGSGWQIQPGMKILGSGIDVTILKLQDNSGAASKVVYAIGHVLSAAARVDYGEVSDLSIDSNLEVGGTSRARCAIRLMGSHTRIRRVKAIGWGSRNPSTPAFVFALITALPSATPAVTDIVDTGIEDCYALSPGSGVLGDTQNTITTIFHVSGQDDLGAVTKEAHAKSPFIRNCYVDALVASPSPTLPIANNPGYRAFCMGWCRGGVIEGNQIYNLDVAGPYQDLRSIRDIIIRNNFLKNVARGPYFNLGQARALGGSPTIAWTGSIGTVSGVNATDLLSLASGDRVALATNQSTVTGVYIIQNVTASTFDISTTLVSPPATTSTLVSKLLSVGRAIIEGNIVELAPSTSAAGIGFQLFDNNGGGTPYVEPPDFAHGDIVFRNNKIRYVDGFFSSSNLGYATDVTGAKNIQVQNNVVDCAPVNPLRNSRCGNATYFNNLMSSGVLVQGYKSDAPTKKYDELQTLTEDAFVLAFAED